MLADVGVDTQRGFSRFSAGFMSNIRAGWGCWRFPDPMHCTTARRIASAGRWALAIRHSAHLGERTALLHQSAPTAGHRYIAVRARSWAGLRGSDRCTRWDTKSPRARRGEKRAIWVCGIMSAMRHPACIGSPNRHPESRATGRGGHSPRVAPANRPAHRSSRRACLQRERSGSAPRDAGDRSSPASCRGACRSPSACCRS